jgi:hypothetical protein
MVTVVPRELCRAVTHRGDPARELALQEWSKVGVCRECTGEHQADFTIVQTH